MTNTPSRTTICIPRTTSHTQVVDFNDGSSFAMTRRFVSVREHHQAQPQGVQQAPDRTPVGPNPRGQGLGRSLRQQPRASKRKLVADDSAADDHTAERSSVSKQAKTGRHENGESECGPSNASKTSKKRKAAPASAAETNPTAKRVMIAPPASQPRQLFTVSPRHT